MLYVPFRHIDQLKRECETFLQAYSIFLNSTNVPASLEDVIRRLSERQPEQEDEDTNEVCMKYFSSFSLDTGLNFW